MIYPFLAAILATADTLFEKSIFNHKRKRYQAFLAISFLFSFIFIGIFFFPWLGSIDRVAYSLPFLVLLGALVVMAAIRNILFYRGFQREGLSEIEPFVVFTPLITILIASAIYPEERNIYILLLAFIATIALIFSHIEKKHLKFDKGLLPIMAAIVIEAAEVNIVKELLFAYSPVALYTVRVGLVTLLLMLFVRPNLKEISAKEYKSLLITSIGWVSIMILTYYSYHFIGVVSSSLIFMLIPIFVVVGSYFIYEKKKIRRRDVFTLLVVTACVAVAQFVR